MKQTTKALLLSLAAVPAFFAAVFLPACSAPATSHAATSAPMAIEAKPTSIVVENRVGRGLIAVRIAMEADSGAPFIFVVPSIDTGAKAEADLTKFMNDDAVMLDPAVHIKQVHITAHDTLGQPHEITAPWAP